MPSDSASSVLPSRLAFLSSAPPICPSSDYTPRQPDASIQQWPLASEHIEIIRKEMNELASTLPKYATVMSMYGVGETYGSQLIAEIGDVSRFTHRKAITAFDGVDSGVNESGQFKQQSNRASKNGSTRLRKTLFQVMSTYFQNC